MEKGANAELGCDGTTPLWIASANGHLDVVATLRWRVKLEPRAIDGATALWVAAENGHEACVQSLIDGGAEVNVRSIDQRTPLHIAAVSALFSVAQQQHLSFYCVLVLLSEATIGCLMHGWMDGWNDWWID
eukprot:scaffold16320_cov25-Prasinocladus_malaysianus.AAC.1